MPPPRRPRRTAPAAPDRPPTTPILIGCCCAVTGVAIDANTRSAVESAAEYLSLRIMARPPVGMRTPSEKTGRSNDDPLPLAALHHVLVTEENGRRIGEYAHCFEVAA